MADAIAAGLPYHAEALTLPLDLTPGLAAVLRRRLAAARLAAPTPGPAIDCPSSSRSATLLPCASSEGTEEKEAGAGTENGLRKRKAAGCEGASGARAAAGADIGANLNKRPRGSAVAVDLLSVVGRWGVRWAEVKEVRGGGQAAKEDKRSEILIFW